MSNSPVSDIISNGFKRQAQARPNRAQDAYPITCELAVLRSNLETIHFQYESEFNSVLKSLTEALGTDDKDRVNSLATRINQLKIILSMFGWL